MGTIYRTICGCVASPPEPDRSEYSDEDDWHDAWHAWETNWERDAADHHPYCCELAQRGDLDRCLEGPDSECPVLAAIAQHDEDEHVCQSEIRLGVNQ